MMMRKAQKIVRLTAGKVFIVNLETFTAMMQNAYSFFTILRNIQES
uniref:Uncharacterized protein n=1 Tax=Timema bartmani TaxID=61472 RepID=A0A7R9IAJ6_9NEOP|nr:unnamed protein product [Timema bartmani]